MSKRLQVVLDEEEMTAIQEFARRQRMTVAEWVRQTLRAARRREPARDAAKKLHAIQRASEHSFPTGDIDQMLEEIERGYRGGAAE